VNAVPTPGRRKAQWSTVEEIKQYILEQGLHPGDPLPTETELCAELGVSRSSVREAMRTLSSLDIVEVRHGHGSFVGGLSMSPLVSGLIFRSVLDSEGELRTLREVVDLRIALDLGTAEELVELHRGGLPRDDLRELVDRMRRHTSRGEPFIEEDGEFHRELLAGLDNTIVRQLVSALWEVHTEAVPKLGLPPARDIVRTVEAHEAMLDALEAGDIEAYRTAVADHYQPLLTAIETAVSAHTTGTDVAEPVEARIS
jgi:DNA-binding FadR family transcriptional regulator